MDFRMYDTYLKMIPANLIKPTYVYIYCDRVVTLYSEPAFHSTFGLDLKNKM